MFIEQPTCPSTEEWRKKLLYLNGMLLSHYKSDIKKFASKLMELKRYPELSNTNPERQIQYVFSYAWILAESQW